MSEIRTWLDGIGLAQYANAFEANDIDVDLLGQVDDQVLKDIGVSSAGHRLRIRNAIARLGPTLGATTGTELEEAKASVADHPLGHARDAEQAQASGERRHVAVMFCDLVDSTGIAAKLDAEEWRDLVRAYLDAASAAVTDMGGKVIKKLGDGLMALFGYPVAQENDAERAVRAALAIQRSLAELNRKNASFGKPALAARIAIDLGPVVIDETGEVFGDVPNVAARAQALADPDTVVVTARVQRHIAGLFVAEERGSHQLKGMPEPVTLYRIVRASGGGRRAGQRHLTPLVGRDEEIAILLRRWERARQGDGQLVLIVGEPGLGKSRLIEEFHTRLRETPHTWVEWSCSQLLQNTALHPITEWGRQRFGGADVSAEQRLADLENSLIQVKLDPAENVTLLAPLLDIPLPQERTPTLTPEELRRRQLAALTNWVMAGARVQPVVLALEDLHWADPTTLELLRGIAERGALAPLFVLITARPEFRPPWGVRSHHGTISLVPLDRQQVREMVSGLAARHALSKEVIEGMTERTGGVPLFVEELTRLLLERGEQGGVQAIPPTLQQSLTARLDRLGSARDVAQIGAVIGRDFSYALLRAVAGIEDRALQTALDRLAEADILLVQGLPPSSDYRFKHALIQDAAYENLLKVRRQTLHRRVGEALCDTLAAASEPEVIAHHFTKAGLDEPAIEWWGKAGDQALHRSAYVEAIEHLGKAIHLAESLPDTPAERRRRLRLLIDYGQALIASRGHGAPETTTAFKRAEQLATGSGDRTERFSARYGMWTGSFVRGEAEPMRALSAAFLRDIAATPGSPEYVMGHRIVGMSRWFEGDYLGARDHLEQALASYDRERHRALVFTYGQDIGAPCMVFLGLALWPLGEIVRARHLVEEAVAYAPTTEHVATIAYSLVHTCLFELLCRDTDALLPHAESLVGMSRDRGLPFWFAYGTFALGYARSRAGEREVGETSMRQGMAMCGEQGICAQVPLFIARHAEAEAEIGHFDSALAMVDDAIALSERTSHHSFDAELHRVRGDTLLRAYRPDLNAAEAALARAIEIARRQHTKTFELRAAMSMTRLWRDQGKREEARDLLAPVYGWFAEGFDTLDLKEAKALLDELGA